MRSVMVLAATLVVSASAAAYPEARLETNLGTITVALEADKAPATVANFIRYAKEGHFNGTVFYRIVPGFVIQAGSMGADGNWRPYHKPIPLETAAKLANTRGTLAMAREEKPASAVAEFFINLDDDNARSLDAKELDPPNTTGYAVFGHVTAGWDVVQAIAKTPIGGGKGPFPANYPKKPVIIKKVTIREVASPVPPVPALAAPTPDQTTPVTAPATVPPPPGSDPGTTP